MSWVLVLELAREYGQAASPPAIVGGYPSREAAEDAGRYATDHRYYWPEAECERERAISALYHTDPAEHRRQGDEWRAKVLPTLRPHYPRFASYAVLPGAASAGPDDRRAALDELRRAGCPHGCAAPCPFYRRLDEILKRYT